MATEWIEIDGICRPAEVYTVALPTCERCERLMSRGPLDAAEVAEREAVLAAWRDRACVCRVVRMEDGGWIILD